jgi:hypothetical protein
MAWLAHQQACPPSRRRTISDLDVSALHLLSAKVVGHIHVLTTPGWNAILAESNAAFIVLMDDDGRTESCLIDIAS